MQQPQALWLLSSRPVGHAGDIAARPTEIGNETTFDRIAAADEHDRYGRGGSPGGAHDDIWADDHSHLALHQIRRECRQPIELVLRPAKFDRAVVAVDQPGFLQAVTNADTRYTVSAEVLASRKPITGIDGRCARAASGQVAAAPPSSVMNVRRCIFAVTQSPRRRGQGASAALRGRVPWRSRG